MHGAFILTTNSRQKEQWKVESRKKRLIKKKTIRQRQKQKKKATRKCQGKRLRTKEKIAFLPNCAALSEPLFSPLWIRKNCYKFALALARGEASLRILDFFERQSGMKFRRRTQQTGRTGKQEQKKNQQSIRF